MPPEPSAEPRAYTLAERWVDGVVHLAGVTAALVAVPVMITLAAVWHGDFSTVGAASIYGASLIAMFAASACYHLIPFPSWKGVLRRLDHAAIYVKIAGTYTPFAVMLGGDWALWILAGIWGAALIGLLMKVIAPSRFERTTLVLYLAMGWAMVVIGGPIFDQASETSIVLMVVGGLLYTAGVVFYLWERLPYQNAIWHALVLAATFVFYAAVMTEVAIRAPVA